MDFWNDMSNSLVDTVCGIIYSGFKTALSVGNTVCIQMPKRALVLYFTIQKELLLLPFRVLNKAYDTLIKRPVTLLLSVYRVFTREDPTAAELLTGEINPSTEHILSSAKEVRKAAIKSIRRENRARTQLHTYRKQLETWKLENEMKTEEIYKLSLEEKELMKAVASALRYLRSLKVKREKMNDCFYDNMSMMIDDGALVTEKLIAMQKKIKTVDAAIKEKKDACLDLLFKGNIVNAATIADVTVPKTPDSKGAQLPAKLLNGNAISTDTMQKILTIVADENVYLKEKISSSQNTLEKILSVSGSIQESIYVLSDKLSATTYLSKEMEELQKKLDEERMLLNSAKEDRDVMREKLETLEFMIKEEESFLGGATGFGETCFEDETVFEDSDYSSFSGGSSEHSTACEATL